jgi:hypothetical protein
LVKYLMHFVKPVLQDSISPFGDGHSISPYIILTPLTQRT